MLRLIEILPVVAVDLSLVRMGIEAHERCGVSYWDGLILAAADRAGCRRVLSEDLSTGQQYGTVRTENPIVTPSTT